MYDQPGMMMGSLADENNGSLQWRESMTDDMWPKVPVQTHTNPQRRNEKSHKRMLDRSEHPIEQKSACAHRLRQKYSPCQHEACSVQPTWLTDHRITSRGSRTKW